MVLKLIAPLIPEAIKHYINICLEKKRYPSIWKDEIVCPTYKKGDKTDKNHFRPFNNFNELAKVMEYHAHDQTLEHMI